MDEAEKLLDECLELYKGVDAWGRYKDARQKARVAVLAAMRKGGVPCVWYSMETLVHQDVSDKPLTVDGKIVPATYTSDPVILTNGKRVWVERSVIMGGALSSSADKFTAYPSGNKPTHWMPLPPAPEAAAPQPPAPVLDRDGVIEACAVTLLETCKQHWSEPNAIDRVEAIEFGAAAIRAMKGDKT